MEKKVNINAIFNEDDKTWRFVLSGGHYLVNDIDIFVKGTSYDKETIVVNDDNGLRISKLVVSNIISYYVHRETDNKLTVFEYDSQRSACRNSDGEFNSLEDEYQFKKLERDYIAVKKNVLTEQTDYNVIQFKEQKNNLYDIIFNRSYTREVRLRYNQKIVFIEIIKEILSDFNIPIIEKKDKTLYWNRTTKQPYAILYLDESYKLLELNGNEYTITEIPNKEFEYPYEDGLKYIEQIRKGVFDKINGSMKSAFKFEVSSIYISQLKDILHELKKDSKLINNSDLRNKIKSKIVKAKNVFEEAII